MTWFWYAIIWTFLAAFYLIGTKLFLKSDQSDPISMLILIRIVGVIFFTLLSILTWDNYNISIDPTIVVVFLGGAVLFTAANLLFFTSLRSVDLSEASLINAIQPILVLLLGVMLFGETWAWTKLIAISISFLGVTSIYWTGKELVIGRGQRMIIIAICLYSLGTFSDKYLLQRLPVIPTLTAGMFATGVLIFVTSKQKASHILSLLREKDALALLGLGLLMSIASAFILQAYAAGGEASEISLTFYLSTIITVLAGLIFLRERERLLQKIIATGAVFIGLILIYR